MKINGMTIDLNTIAGQNMYAQILAQQSQTHRIGAQIGYRAPQVQSQSHLCVQQHGREREYDLNNLRDVNEIFAMFAAQSQARYPENIRNRR